MSRPTTKLLLLFTLFLSPHGAWAITQEGTMNAIDPAVKEPLCQGLYALGYIAWEGGAQQDDVCYESILLLLWDHNLYHKAKFDADEVNYAVCVLGRYGFMQSLNQAAGMARLCGDVTPPPQDYDIETSYLWRKLDYRATWLRSAEGQDLFDGSNRLRRDPATIVDRLQGDRSEAAHVVRGQAEAIRLRREYRYTQATQ